MIVTPAQPMPGRRTFLLDCLMRRHRSALGPETPNVVLTSADAADIAAYVFWLEERSGVKAIRC